MIAKGVGAIFQNNDSLRYYSLGRHALLAALRLLGVKAGERVLLPSFMCREFLAPIYELGATSVYYDVNEKLQPVTLPVLSSTRAVIAVNYFGFPQDLTPFREYCASRGAALIEDNAHGFLSRDEKGLFLGCRGDVGIFSLRKTFHLPNGAALVINNRSLLGHLPVPLACCEDPLPQSFIFKRFLRQFQNSTGIRVRTASEQLVRTIRRVRTGRSLPESLPEAERIIPGFPAIHRESLEMLKSFDGDREVARRRELFLFFHQALSCMELVPVYDKLPEGAAPYGYPFRATGHVAQAVAKAARNKGLDCSRWPDLPDAVVTAAPDYYRNVWWINFLC